METLILGTTKEDILKAGEIIKRGGLVAFPTETVYGLGANALNSDAAKNIYLAKGRPSDNPMIVHISKFSDMEKLTDFKSKDIEILNEKFWPGPLTMIVPALPIIPRVTLGGLDTVAIRMPSSIIARDLISYSGLPIAAPSANLSGKPSPTTYQHCIDDLTGKVDAIICGDDCEVGIESTVIDMTVDPPMILRPGIITKEELSNALGKEVSFDPALLEKGTNVVKPKAPGQKYKHYAPNAEMIIYSGEKDKVISKINLEKEKQESLGKKVKVLIFSDVNPKTVAHDFFKELRECDKEKVDLILATSLDLTGVGFSVMNRMFKSAGYNIVEVK